MTVTRKGKGAYAGYAVRAWTGHTLVPPVTVTRKGKGAIGRLCRTSMEAILYGHRRNTERVRGTYARYAVRAWKQYYTVIEEIPKG